MTSPFLLLGWLLLSGDLQPPAASQPPVPAQPADPAGPTEGSPQPALPSPDLADELASGANPSFAIEPLELSAVLTEAVANNINLQLNSLDMQITEARVLAALGVYDVFLTSGITGSYIEQPQRGSAFTAVRGSKTLSGFVGFRRSLETGGSIDLRLDASRTLSLQPSNFLDPNSPATNIATYRVAPSLTLTHQLLRGAGLRVNRAAIERAKLAASSAEAARQLTAQNLVRDLVSAYWDVLYASRDLANKRHSLGLAGKQLERTRALVAAGRTAPVELKAVEQAQAARENDVLVAENTLLDVSLNLRTFMGQDLSARPVLGVLPVTDPVVAPRAVDVAQELETSLRGHPQVRQFELAMASRRVDELEMANARLPQLTFTGTFTPQGRSVDTLPNASSGDPGVQGSWGQAFKNFFATDRSEGLLADWVVSGSLNFTWDVQNRGPKGNHQAALGELRKAEINLRQVRQTVATQVIRASNSLRTAGKRMEVAQISLELADQNLAAEQARFEVGRATNFDVLKRLDERDKSASDALNAHVQYLKALVQLQAVNGEILPAYGIPLDSIRSWAPPRSGPAVGAHVPAQGGSRGARPGPQPGSQRDDLLRPVSASRRSRL